MNGITLELSLILIFFLTMFIIFVYFSKTKRNQQLIASIITVIGIKPQFWNNAFATEATQACKEYAENALNKNRLISIIHPQNIASKCVAQNLGAEKENVITFLGSEHEVYVY